MEQILIQEISSSDLGVSTYAIGGAGCGGLCLGFACSDLGGPAPTGLGCGAGCDGAGCAGGGIGAGCGGACAGAGCGVLC